MVTINLFWIVLLIILIHTILQHLINWGWRDTEDAIGVVFIATLAEFVALILTLVATFY